MWLSERPHRGRGEAISCQRVALRSCFTSGEAWPCPVRSVVEVWWWHYDGGRIRDWAWSQICMNIQYKNQSPQKKQIFRLYWCVKKCNFIIMRNRWIESVTSSLPIRRNISNYMMSNLVEFNVRCNPDLLTLNQSGDLIHRGIQDTRNISVSMTSTTQGNDRMKNLSYPAVFCRSGQFEHVTRKQ